MNLPEPALRLGIFAVTLLLLLLGERIWAREPVPIRGRWAANFGLVGLATLLGRLAVPAGATGAAMLAASRGWGLFNRLGWPDWLEGLLAFVALDLLLYWQHRVSHRWPPLWRLHRVHHCDLALDATTGVRFHPVEILLSLLLKSAAAIALGAPVAAVLAFEIALSACALFNHANLRLSPRIERRVRRVLVTPALHRIHHSTRRERHDSNYGFSGPWWDHAFGTYRQDSLDEPVGLPQFREPPAQRLGALLGQPFSASR